MNSLSSFSRIPLATATPGLVAVPLITPSITIIGTPAAKAALPVQQVQSAQRRAAQAAHRAQALACRRTAILSSAKRF